MMFMFWGFFWPRDRWILAPRPGIKLALPALEDNLFKNFIQFVVIHTVKGFGIFNKAKVDVFLELSCFFDDPADVCKLISGFSAFLNPA